jgi:prevent-host-death family protein
MATIPQRELRNHSGDILRRAETGEQFTITVDGRPVARLVPYPRRQWVPRTEYLRLFEPGPDDPTFFEDIRELGGTVEDLHAAWEEES